MTGASIVQGKISCTNTFINSPVCQEQLHILRVISDVAFFPHGAFLLHLLPKRSVSFQPPWDVMCNPSPHIFSSAASHCFLKPLLPTPNYVLGDSAMKLCLTVCRGKVWQVFPSPQLQFPAPFSKHQNSSPYFGCMNAWFYACAAIHMLHSYVYIQDVKGGACQRAGQDGIISLPSCS